MTAQEIVEEITVSIHVPARGTTGKAPDSNQMMHVSIHVPARGTTSAVGDKITELGVSIHVPARGTTQVLHLLLVSTLFQSTFPHGERRQMSIEDYFGNMFQSTFPHGERRNTIRTRYSTLFCFNPRSRTGNDRLLSERLAPVCLFQSTFPHGERQVPAGHAERREDVSIHVPARGTTRSGRHTWRRRKRFNPRSRTGNDRIARSGTGLITCFNPRSRTGNDDVEAGELGGYIEFQSTFPHGERRRGH